jgi:hypothetical protein
MGAGGGNRINTKADRDGTLRITLRCAGPGPLMLTMSTDRDSVQTTAHQCDGGLDQLPERLDVRAGESVTVTVDGAAALSYAVKVVEGQ